MRILLAAFVCLACAVAASGAAADWRDTIKVFRVGFLATGTPAQEIARMEPFRAYLESRIGVPVELVPATTLDGLIDAQLTDRVQYAIHSASSYAAAEASCDCLEPVAVPSALDGEVGYYAILLVRAESAITDLPGARGRSLTLAGGDSVAGRLIPEKELASEGIDLGSYFSGVRTAAGPDAAIRDLIAGDTDVAVGWSSLSGDPVAGYSFGVLTRLVIDGTLAQSPLRMIWQSRLIPFGPHVVAKALDPELKSIVADALFSMATVDPAALDAVDRSGFGGGGFVGISDADYAPLAALVNAP